MKIGVFPAEQRSGKGPARLKDVAGREKVAMLIPMMGKLLVEGKLPTEGFSKGVLSR